MYMHYWRANVMENYDSKSKTEIERYFKVDMNALRRDA